MPKSVYYYQLGAGSKADPYREVKQSIKTIYHRHKGRYGYRRVQEELGHQNCYLNPKTVQKLMGRLHLKSTVRPKRYQSYKGPESKAAPNLLERKFSAAKPNQKWVTDVTEFNIKGEKVYLSPILDLYNQEKQPHQYATCNPRAHQTKHQYTKLLITTYQRLNLSPRSETCSSNAILYQAFLDLAPLSNSLSS